MILNLILNCSYNIINEGKLVDPTNIINIRTMFSHRILKYVKILRVYKMLSKKWWKIIIFSSDFRNIWENHAIIIYHFLPSLLCLWNISYPVYMCAYSRIYNKSKAITYVLRNEILIVICSSPIILWHIHTYICTK